MRPKLIVVHAPSFDLRARIVKKKKPVQIDALIPRAAVERFDERIVCGFSAP